MFFSLSKPLKLPTFRHSIFSQNLYGAVVCFCGLNIDEKKELGDLVRWLGGIVSPHLISETTHLVTDCCNIHSAKYLAAQRMHLPVLSPEWIKEAWRLALECDHVLCTSSEIYEPYVVRVYTKYKRTTTRSAASQSSQSQSKSIVDLPLYQDERREVQDNISSGHPICWHDATEISSANFLNQLEQIKKRTRISASELNRWEENSSIAGVQRPAR